MRFPLAIAHTVTLDRREYRISSERYLLHHIEEELRELNMSRMQAGENELFLMKTDPIKGINRRTYLRNLLVRVEIDQEKIHVRLQTETILVFIFGSLPVLATLSGQIPFQFALLGVGIWAVGYLIKTSVLQSVRNDVETMLRKLKDA